MSTESRQAPSYPLRMPDEMKAALQAAAEKQMRSLNAEIVARLASSETATEDSLRDRIAMEALGALITCAPNHGDIPHDIAAADAYRYADAMIKARAAS